MRNVMRVFFTLIILFLGCKVFAQKPNGGVPGNVLILLDGQPVTRDTIDKLNKNDIVEITVLKGNAATSLYGEKAANGVLLISSKKGAIKAYQWKFSSLSKEYSDKIKALNDEKDIVYILDNIPLIDSYEIKLLKINPEQIKEIKLIDSKTTKLNYGLDRKEGAIIINTK